jgi:hypothetical protein
VSRYRTVYPPDWKLISLRIRFERAQGKCEWCGAVYQQPHPVTGSIVVLTVAHLGAPRDDGSPGDKHDKSDCRDVNLAALCQRCHLNFDREDHLARQRLNRLKRHVTLRKPVQLALPL